MTKTEVYELLDSSYRSYMREYEFALRMEYTDKQRIALAKAEAMNNMHMSVKNWRSFK